MSRERHANKNTQRSLGYLLLNPASGFSFLLRSRNYGYGHMRMQRNKWQTEYSHNSAIKEMACKMFCHHREDISLMENRREIA